METQVDEIAAGVYRLSTYTEAIAGGFTFNQFLVDTEEPLLYHTGMRGLFPLVSQAIEKVMPLDRLRWVSFAHVEADECGAVNDVLAWWMLAVVVAVAGTARHNRANGR